MPLAEDCEVLDMQLVPTEITLFSFASKKNTERVLARIYTKEPNFAFDFQSFITNQQTKFMFNVHVDTSLHSNCD